MKTTLTSKGSVPVLALVGVMAARASGGAMTSQAPTQSHHHRTARVASRYGATLGALLTLAVAPAAHAGTLDQQTGANAGWRVGFSDNRSAAQTFTAGLTGALDRVDLHLAQGSGSGSATIEIRNVEPGGAPGSTVLATASTAALPRPEWVPVEFASPAAVASGERYAIVAYAGAANSFTWSRAEPAYPGGASFSSPFSPPSTWEEGAWDSAFKTYVALKADLSLSMVGPATATSKSQVTYLLTVRNAGPSTATNVVLSDNLPYGTQFSTVTASQGSCTPPGRNGTKVVCRLGDIASGGDSNSAVTLKITARASQANINNVASVSSDVLDPNTSNNSASFTTTLVK